MTSSSTIRIRAFPVASSSTWVGTVAGFDSPSQAWTGDEMSSPRQCIHTDHEHGVLQTFDHIVASDGDHIEKL